MNYYNSLLSHPTFQSYVHFNLHFPTCSSFHPPPPFSLATSLHTTRRFAILNHSVHKLNIHYLQPCNIKLMISQEEFFQEGNATPRHHTWTTTDHVPTQHDKTNNHQLAKYKQTIFSTFHSSSLTKHFFFRSSSVFYSLFVC